MLHDFRGCSPPPTSSKRNAATKDEKGTVQLRYDLESEYMEFATYACKMVKQLNWQDFSLPVPLVVPEQIVIE
jgi:hypothetical protein